MRLGVLVPGAVIEHDSPAGVHYTWQIGMLNNQPNAKLVLAGVSRESGQRA